MYKRQVIDLVGMKAIHWDEATRGTAFEERDIPDQLKSEADDLHEQLLEAAAEADDTLMELYLESGTLSTTEIKTGLRKRTLANEIVPVTCGSAFKNKGVQAMLDAVIDYMPNPTEVPAIRGVVDAENQDVERASSDDEPFAALGFKIMTDPFVGQLAFVRVYSGELTCGSYVYNSTKNAKERVGRILRMHANKREEVDVVRAGDIAAVIGLKKSYTGDTLCDKDHPIILEAIQFPEPVISVAIEPKTKAEQDKLSDCLVKLLQEDPTFQVRLDDETGQTIMSGMGELHLEILIDRLFREFKVEANVGRPQVAYKEGLKKAVEAIGRFVRQSGGRGQFGHVELEIEPGDPGTGLIFESNIVGGNIPREYINPVRDGILEAMTPGPIAG